MAVPFSIVKSELDFFEFTYHSAVTWHNNRTIIVWGGYEWGDPLGGEDNSVVHYHLNGEWIGVNTSGKVPCSSFDGEAQVVDDKMIVLCTGECSTAPSLISICICVTVLLFSATVELSEKCMCCFILMCISIFNMGFKWGITVLLI